MMTLDEAIKHAEEVGAGCDTCAAEHRQLAEWLRELKMLRNQQPKTSSEAFALLSALEGRATAVKSEGKDDDSLAVINITAGIICKNEKIFVTDEHGVYLGKFDVDRLQTMDGKETDSLSKTGLIRLDWRGKLKEKDLLFQ